MSEEEIEEEEEEGESEHQTEDDEGSEIADDDDDFEENPAPSTTPAEPTTSQSPLLSAASRSSSPRLKSRSRRSSVASHQPPTRGKPKFTLDEEVDQEDEQLLDDDEDVPAPPKRQQTFGNTNTTSSESFLQQQQRPFKNLDIALKLKVYLKPPAISGGNKSQDSKSDKFSIPAPVAAATANAPTSRTASNAASAVTPVMPASPLYIRFQPEWLAPHDYQYTLEDETWLKQSANAANVVSMEKFESLINQFEIATGTASSIGLTSARAFTLFSQQMGISRAASDDIFHYWSTKRNKFKRSLLRRFWPQATDDDHSPTTTFRLREFENRYKLRKKKMTDLEAFEKFGILQKDFRRMLDLAQLVEKREVLKRMEVELIHAEYLDKLASARGDASLPVRPPCLDVPIPELSYLKAMEHLASSAAMAYGQQQQQLENVRPPRISHHKSNASSSSYFAAGPSVSNASMSSQVGGVEKKKSHKRKRPGDEGYVSAQPMAALMHHSIPFNFPEALYFRDDPVPVPLYLLEDARLLREDPFHAVKLAKLEEEISQPMRGRNRRIVALKGLDPMPPPVEVTNAVRLRIDALLRQERPGEEEYIQRMDLALLRANEVQPPKFQLVV